MIIHNTINLSKAPTISIKTETIRKDLIKKISPEKFGELKSLLLPLS